MNEDEILKEALDYISKQEVVGIGSIQRHLLTTYAGAKMIVDELLKNKSIVEDEAYGFIRYKINK